MPVDDAPEDDETRETYNFAPGYYGLIYRADVPDTGAPRSSDEDNADEEAENSRRDELDSSLLSGETKYKLQAMKWGPFLADADDGQETDGAGLVPFWTKRNPDYGSLMKTINARDDSLSENRGMWTSMKKKKRCIVVAQGFYEWLKKSNSKDKIPHFVKRNDDQLMCFAGLWDCVHYEGRSPFDVVFGPA